MRYTNVLAAAMVAPLVAAHGGDIPGAPKMFGLPKDVRRRYPPVAHAIHHEEAPKLEARQGGAGGQCGPTANGAKCDDGYCCSGSGWCGKGADYCRAPDCLFQYGSGCDANQTPAGASTRNDVRAPLGNVEKGVGIYKCRQPGTVAITYDDGPYSFTGDVLDKFNAAGAKATFFITGNNIGKGAIDTTSQWSSVIKRMVAEGHQVASHTWSHQNLDSITEEEIYDQMVKNEMALRNILGKYPTYMRPPYSACVTDKCLNIMGKLGYVVSYFDLDTNDYNLLTKEKIETAKLNFKNGVDGAKSDVNGDHRLAIGHDIHQLTAEDLTIYMLEYLQTTGYKAVTMGECMNDPETNWYRSSTPGSTTPSSTRSASSTVASTASGTSSGSTSVPTGKVSTDGNCGSAAGTICSGSTFGNCCSQYNFCGSTADHCGSGCNPLFGTCGQVSSSVSSVVSSSSASQSAFVSTSKPASSTAIPSTTQSASDKEGSSSAVSTASQSATGKQSSSAVPTTDKNSSAPAPTSKASSAGSSAVSSTAEHGASSTSVEHGSSSSVEHGTSSTAEHDSYPTGASSTAEHESYPTESVSSSVSEHESYPTESVSSTAEHESYPTESVSSSASEHDDYPVSTSKPSTPHASVSSVASVSSSTPVASSTVPTDNRSSSTDCSTSTSVPVTSAVYATSSASATTECTTSTFSTAVRSSTPSPTPTGLVVSKDGKCGGKNGQTCSGYKNPFGQAMECCCKTSGKCSNDPWACGQGCDKTSGKCSSY